MDYGLYYLTGNQILKVVLPKNMEATTVYSVAAPQPDEQFEISRLSCGPEGKLVFQLTRTVGPSRSDPSVSVNQRTGAATYDPHTGKLTHLVDLPDQYVFCPTLSADGSKLAVSGRLSFFIKDFGTNKTEYYSQFEDRQQWVCPFSWSPDGKLLALSISKLSQELRTYLFDTDRKILLPWQAGSQPHFSPTGRLIAYIVHGNKKLVISDMEGNMKQSFEGFFFKDLNGWIGEDRVVFTIGVFGYLNHIGIADLKTRKVYDIKVPLRGEINGICARENPPAARP